MVATFRPMSEPIVRPHPGLPLVRLWAPPPGPRAPWPRGGGLSRPAVVPSPRTPIRCHGLDRRERDTDRDRQIKRVIGDGANIFVEPAVFFFLNPPSSNIRRAPGPPPPPIPAVTVGAPHLFPRSQSFHALCGQDRSTAFFAKIGMPVPYFRCCEYAIPIVSVSSVLRRWPFPLLAKPPNKNFFIPLCGLLGNLLSTLVLALSLVSHPEVALRFCVRRIDCM